MTREVEIIVGVRGLKDLQTGREEDKKVYFLPWEQEDNQKVKSLETTLGEDPRSTNYLWQSAPQQLLVCVMNKGFTFYDILSKAKRSDFPFVKLEAELAEDVGKLINDALCGSIQQLEDKVFCGLYLKGDRKNEGLALVRFDDFFHDLEKRETCKQFKVTVPLCQYQNNLIVCEDTVAYRCPPDLSEKRPFLKTESPLIAAASLEDLLCFTSKDGKYHVFKDGKRILTEWNPYRLVGEPRSLWGVARSLAIRKQGDDYYLFFGVYGEVKTMKVSAQGQVEFIRQLSFYKEPFFTDQDKDKYREGKIRNMKVTSRGFLVFTLENTVFKVDLQHLIDPTPLPSGHTHSPYYKKLLAPIISMEVREED